MGGKKKRHWMLHLRKIPGSFCVGAHTFLWGKECFSFSLCHYIILHSETAQEESVGEVEYRAMQEVSFYEKNYKQRVHI